MAEPGDEIIVESPSYPGALQVFQINGLRAIPVPVDDEGMRVDHVEAMLRNAAAALHLHDAVAAQSDQRNDERRPARAPGDDRAARRRSDRRGRSVRSARAAPATPLVALAPDYVVYLSTFSKTIAPSLRVGWLAAPRTILERLLLRKQAYDMATSLYVQAAIADYLERGYDAHVAQLRDELLERRARRRSPRSRNTGRRRCKVSRPAGGFYLWASTPRELRARALLDAAERLGASFLFGEPFFAQLRRRPLFSPRADGRYAAARFAEGIRRIGEAFSAVRA